MCFSAAGSFTLAAVLTGVGAASISRKVDARVAMLAVVPLLFAVQQAAEGVVWLTIDAASAHAALQHVAVVVFLGFAIVVWPVWSPLSLLLIERGTTSRRRALAALTALGAAIAVSAAVLLSRWQPVAVVEGHSISYHWAGSRNAIVEIGVLLAYAAATVLPFFASSMKYARTIGVTLVVSVVVTMLVQREALTSVWCFFAAVVSCLVVVAVNARRASDGPALS